MTTTKLKSRKHGNCDCAIDEPAIKVVRKTTLGYGEKSGQHRNISQTNDLTLKKHERFELSSVRFYNQSLKEATKLSEKLRLSVEVLTFTANIIYRLKDDLSYRQFDKHALAVACLFVASRQALQARSLSEILKATTVKRKYAMRLLTRITRRADIKYRSVGSVYQYIELFCHRLRCNVCFGFQSLAETLAKRIDESNIVGSPQPPVLAAISVYIVAEFYQLQITVEDVIAVSSVSKSTILGHYSKLVAKLNEMSIKRERAEHYDSHVQVCMDFKK
ncbi:hypothetical protein ACOME3_002309 [Neoechinorhynchus agilis]